MRPWLLDLLACPLDCAGPLALHVLERAADGEAVCALLRCPECGVVYAALEGVPHLVRPALRLAAREQGAVRSAGGIPPQWLEALERTWREAGAREPADEVLLEEGRYWSAFFQLYYDLDSLTVFDARVKGAHMPYLGLGVRATDERDRRRLHDTWPNPLGRRILRFFEETRAAGAALYLDLGCGGGQFGLEAAWRGARTVGVDVAVGALELGRRYALRKQLNASYVYAEPARLPFRGGAFDALTVKDALHHLPDARVAAAEAARVLRPGAPFLMIEHAAEKPRWEWLGRKILEWLGPAIARRYPPEAPPAILQRRSPREGAGQRDLEPILGDILEIKERRGELLFADEFALPVYFATGRRRWPAEWISAGVYALERLALQWGRPRFLYLRGTTRGSAV
ncbi:MAG: methyltransferase domain-containing protein [Candidatus Sumerlaeota bacterium]|nr:methyltransferase domain-containing protein [Candidatus Sumerlaeota bacterium]